MLEFMHSEFSLRQVEDDFIDFSVGMPGPELIPKKMLDVEISRLITENEDPFIYQYQSIRGSEMFRLEILKFLEIPSSFLPRIFVTSGISASLAQIVRTLNRPGNFVILEEPTYFLAPEIFRGCGKRVLFCPCDSGGMIFSELQNLISENDVSFIYIIPHFRNPTGNNWDYERLEQVVALASRSGIFILSDEPYSQLGFSEQFKPLHISTMSDWVISLCTFSKILVPGLRLGYIFTSPEISQLIGTDGVIQSGGGPPGILAEAVRRLMVSGNLSNFVSNCRSELERRKISLCTALRDKIPGCQFSEPQGGYFLWLKLPHPVSNSNLEISKVRLLQGACKQYSADFSNFVRLSFSFYPSEKLIEGVSRLASHFK